MSRRWEIGALVLGLVIPGLMVSSWLGAAAKRRESAGQAEPQAPLAAAADEGYCTESLRGIVRRVAASCGLIGGSTRGCTPADARQVASLSEADFNALFLPLQNRATLVQFAADATDLDDSARRAVEEAWSDQRGASFFFVVSRASADGGIEKNRELSEGRARAVLTHLETRFQDPQIRGSVGLLWLGEEFAQLRADPFCGWKRSGGAECTDKDINRSAFVAWIDCAI